MPKRIDKAEELHYDRSKKNDKGASCIIQI